MIPVFELPRDVTRVWDLEVPVVVDEPKKTITAYITGAITEPYAYNELCFLLDTAKASTKVNIHINCLGGVIDSALMLVNSIRRSPAKTTAYLTGTVASAGTIIALACDNIEVSDHLSFMVHNYSSGMIGKGHEMKARQKFTDDHLEEAFKDFYKGFLSEEEIQTIIDGADLWMGSSEVASRWNTKISYMKGSK